MTQEEFLAHVNLSGVYRSMSESLADSIGRNAIYAPNPFSACGMHEGINGAAEHYGEVLYQLELVLEEIAGEKWDQVTPTEAHFETLFPAKEESPRQVPEYDDVPF